MRGWRGTPPAMPDGGVGHYVGSGLVQTEGWKGCCARRREGRRGVLRASSGGKGRGWEGRVSGGSRQSAGRRGASVETERGVGREKGGEGSGEGRGRVREE